ncbi:MAG: hypothetical protein UV38_C0002G0262 [candidate division TM6 bacterium GW2011_GWE2_42_60]|nr:MAG: hypothetical protein UV38_C0002G0262 [candidate division TM6 bacterium GW2011_GWE2_42_60]HBY05986.1 hypothetical protein [Candidatus Dependentiae bacterium]
MNKNRLFLACAFIAFGAVFSSNVFGTLEQPSKPEQQIVSNERVEEDSTTKIASDLQENNKKLKEALKEALDKSKENEKKLEEAVKKNKQLKEKNKKNITLQEKLKKREKELEENLTFERENIKELEKNIKNLKKSKNFKDAFNTVSLEKRDLQERYDELKNKYEPTASEEELRKQQLLKQEQATREKHSQDRWFGFSTGFAVPFIYSLFAGKTFDSLKFGMSEKASRTTLEASLGLMAINAVFSSMTYTPGKEAIHRHLFRNQWAMINPIAKMWLGPVACALVKDHCVLPFISSSFFSLVQSEYDNEGNRMAWSHQAGILSGMLAGRTCNEGIKFVGRMLSRNKAQAAFSV